MQTSIIAKHSAKLFLSDKVLEVEETKKAVLIIRNIPGPNLHLKYFDGSEPFGHGLDFR